MSEIISAEVAAKIKQELKQLDKPVRLLFFTQPHACGACADQLKLLESLSGLSDKISLEVFQLESPEASEHNIDKVPATVVRDEQDYGVCFYGLTGGYEFESLLEAIVLVSLGSSRVDPAIIALSAAITVPVHIEVMVTLACPYCPKMVRVAHQLAVANKLVRADMVESSEFPQLVNRYDVHGVPLTVVNGKRGFEGALPAEQAVLEVIKVVDPDAYENMEARLREAKGLRHARDAKTADTYDVIVVGAGPAGLAAALYAQRKGLNTALIGKQAGGQVNDTAVIENYPGLVQVGGSELAQALRLHVEAYPVAERCHTQVKRIEHEKKTFKVHTDNQEIYKSHSLIYCAGKRYRRLNVTGEDKFIGRGVAWCATCDAPLYKGKRVAVVGGGNSAFTAARDLLRYAKIIHLVHVLDEFQADPVLVQEIKQAEKTGKVQIHLKSQVREYLGGENLEGLRLADPNNKALHDLVVDGVFLEIGLEPNSAAIAGLLELNQTGEVPVKRDQSTSVPGLFAAGDVTDEIEKQIVVAAGAGAKAALAADRYLSSLGLVSTQTAGSE